MDPIENAAHVSIGRACGFAGLGIFCVMVGLSYEPDLAARAGGMLFLIMVLILAFRAGTARTRPYKKTELWLIIDKEKRPPEGIAQQVVGEALREAYLSFAESTALIAFVLLIAALVLGFAEETRRRSESYTPADHSGRPRSEHRSEADAAVASRPRFQFSADPIGDHPFTTFGSPVTPL